MSPRPVPAKFRADDPHEGAEGLSRMPFVPTNESAVCADSVIRR